MKINSIMAGVALCLTLMGASCNGEKSKDEERKEADVPTRVAEVSPFSADSAYLHIEQQLSFGPRVPNTPGHRAAASYLSGELKRQGLQVTEQRMTLEAYDGTALDAVNIIGAFQPERAHRVLLFAHWDTRFMADYDPDPAKRHLPIPGADDGASGPGVLLEIARLLGSLGREQLSNIGVDIILFDAEDYGLPAHEHSAGSSERTWALGTQYWTKNRHRPDYHADFGILLDMVGAKDATFYREYFSQEYAGKYVTMIWQIADALGHGRYFINKMGGAVTDDHYFVNIDAKIPSVDIINYDPNSHNGFADYWHTHADTIDNIDKATLQAVGEVVWQVLLHYDATLATEGM